MKILCFSVLLLLFGVLGKKIKKDDHSKENKELYEFHNIKHSEKKESQIDHRHHYKEITEENYERHDMGYHTDYSPIEETR